jgi:protein TonB
MVRALMAGSTTWVVVFLLGLAASAFFLHQVEQVKVPRVVITTIPPPIFVEKQPTPPPVVPPSAPMTKGKIVPGPEVTETTFEDRVEAPPVHEGPTTTEAGTRRIDVPPSADDGEPPPDRWVDVDELPEAITRIEPQYPEIAREAGVSGTVYVRVLVGKDGRVRDALVEPKHSIPMLDEAALEAARRWVFKPAFTNNQPVPVWVAIPMKFSLHY